MTSLLQLAALVLFAILTPLIAIGWTVALPGLGNPGPVRALLLGGLPLLWLALVVGLIYWIGDWHLVGVVAGGLVILGLVKLLSLIRWRRRAPLLARLPAPPAWIDPET